MGGQKFTVQHSGRKSSVSLQGNGKQLEAFQASLLREGFSVISENESFLEFKRDIHLFAGDWPISLRIKRDNGILAISYFMFIPWSWIIVFALMVLVFLPFATFRGAPLAFLLALGVIVLAVYKQRFDFSPNASWQGPPRKLWNDRLNQLLAEAFDSEIQ